MRFRHAFRKWDVGHRLVEPIPILQRDVAEEGIAEKGGGELHDGGGVGTPLGFTGGAFLPGGAR